MRLRLDHISKKFISLRGHHYALNDISLDIADQEFFVLLGPSGCGKSTLLNLVAGLEKPTDGMIQFDDTVVASASDRILMPPRKRNVAMVFQSYALYPHMNVFDNIAFPLRIARETSGDIDQAVHQAADMLQVNDLLKAKPAELSGGQRQRVAIARAIVRRPGLFLLDEPLSNLDAQLRLSMRAELKNLQRELGITTLYVTHDQVEAMTLGDRVAVLRDGRVEQIGKPDELYSRPVNTFVATFVGSPPMNLLDADISRVDDGIEIRAGSSVIILSDTSDIGADYTQPRNVTLGIRPEHVRIVDERSRRTITATIEAVESLGRERLLHVSIDTQRLTILTDGAGHNRGDTITITFDPEKIRIFKKS